MPAAACRGAYQIIEMIKSKHLHLTSQTLAWVKLSPGDLHVYELWLPVYRYLYNISRLSIKNISTYRENVDSEQGLMH